MKENSTPSGRLFLVGFLAQKVPELAPTHRSMLIAQRLRMDAVHSMTSSDVHMSQTCCPYDQCPITSYATASGMTSTATRISGPARVVQVDSGLQRSGWTLVFGLSGLRSILVRSWDALDGL